MYLKRVIHDKLSAKVCTMYVLCSVCCVCSSGSRFLVYTVGSKGANQSPLCLPVATPLNTYTSVAQPERIPCAVAQNYNTIRSVYSTLPISVFLILSGFLGQYYLV